ncbi:MAG: pentapeptide repeat-containing protein [Chloroflexota bacterium]
MLKEECAYEGCGLRPCDASGFCILHSPNPEKDSMLFQETLSERIKQSEDDTTVETINLEGVVFPPRMAWGGRIFRKNVSFKGARFIGPTDFSWVWFSENVDFSQGEFCGTARFHLARFSKSAEFRAAHFSQEADFSSARFGNDTKSFIVADFCQAQFLGDTDFSEAKFSSITTFNEGRFHRAADFKQVQFLRGAAFIGAEFGGETAFDGTSFSDSAYFFDGRFRDNVSFRAASFSNKADFSGSTFQGALHFHKTIFPMFEGQGILDFRNVILSQPENVYFQHVNLSRASFLCTDVRRVNFSSVTWAKREELRLGWLPLFREKVFAVYDHLTLMEKAPEERDANSCRLVESIYQQLRSNLEGGKQRIEAGDFHIGEMEMRRLNAETPVAYRCHLWLYRLFALYGERYSRPLFYYLLFGASFAFLHVMFGPEAKDALGQHAAGTWGPSARHFFSTFSFWTYLWTPVLTVQLLLQIAKALLGWAFWEHYGMAFVTSVAILPLFQEASQPLSSVGILLRSLNLAVNVFFIGLALVGLRRRFKR